jgi:hypothetical protein
MIKISSRDTSRIIYTAIVLDNRSRQQLHSRYPGIHENYFANHVTLTFGKNEPHPRHGEQVNFVADGYANDNKGEAVTVNIGDIEHTTTIPHITISTASGIPPKYSQELLSGKIEKIPPIQLSGRIAAYNGRSFI